MDSYKLITQAWRKIGESEHRTFTVYINTVLQSVAKSYIKYIGIMRFVELLY